jgi:LPXTG-motif cell wall-anchored protein
MTNALSWPSTIRKETFMHSLIRPIIALIFMLWLTSVATAAPQLSVVSPAEGETIVGSTVKVVVNTSDFELVKAVVPVTEAGKRPDANEAGKGMVHLKFDLLPLAILDQGDTYTFTDIPAGEHQLEVELATNDHSVLSPPVVQVVHFRTVAAQTLPSTGEAPASMPALLSLAVLLLAGGGFALRRAGLRLSPEKHQLGR